MSEEALGLQTCKATYAYVSWFATGKISQVIFKQRLKLSKAISLSLLEKNYGAVPLPHWAMVSDKVQSASPGLDREKKSIPVA